jgi:MinD superfamily P-loop ATPase
MKMNKAKNIEQESKKLGLKFLAEIPYDLKVEEAIGDEKKLHGTTLAQRIKEVAASSITQ